MPAKLLTTHFWNPAIQRVLVTDGSSPDRLRGVNLPDRARRRRQRWRNAGPRRPCFRRRVGLSSDSAGHACVRRRSPRQRRRATPMVSFLAEGWFKRSGYLGPAGQFVVAAPAPDASLHRRLILRLQSDRHRPKAVLSFATSSGLRRRVTIGERPTAVSLPVSGRGVWSSEFAQVSGRLSPIDGQMVSVRVLSVALRPTLRHAT